MYYRRKILLSLLKIFGGSLPKIDFQKYLFLFNVYKNDPFFSFIPYKYGCFSFQANQDMSTMVKYNLVEESENHWHLKSDKNYIIELEKVDQVQLKEMHRKYGRLKGKELIKFVYEQYPYYSINSTIADKILDDKKLKTVKNCRPNKSESALFSIGYEGKSIEQFTNELIKEDVHVLCDIRKNALSMKYGFSKKQLKFIVENAGIKYIHIPALGIQSNKRQQLNSKKDYENLFRDYEKNILPGKPDELEELYRIFVSHKRIALMCFEADHTYCHRSRTINALENKFGNKFVTKHL